MKNKQHNKGIGTILLKRSIIIFNALVDNSNQKNGK